MRKKLKRKESTKNVLQFSQLSLTSILWPSRHDRSFHCLFCARIVPHMDCQLVTWAARSCPWTGCVPWLSFSERQCSSCAGPRLPGGIYRSTGLDTGKVGEPCSASPAPTEDGGERAGEEHGGRC